ncbi:MAG: hypothetical protein IAX22_02920 [Candidatus Bathyarchaeota archaeon]|nr:hypothetical protein [Candidatus Bathyarchaeota archaeon]
MTEFDNKSRRELEAKLATVLDDKIACLPVELKKILLDDLVTAFESRLTLLNNIA